MIKASAISVLKKAVSAEFERYFPVIKAAAPRTPKRKLYGRRQLADLKAYVEANGRNEWEDYKRGQMGRKRKVSDEDFMLFLNGQSSITLPADDGNTL